MSARASFISAALLLAFAPACSSDDAAKTATPSPEGGTKTDPYPEPVTNDCITELKTGTEALALNCQQLDVKLTVPEKCRTEACGFIVDVHGFAMDADLENENTKFRTLATEQGYIVLQPTAPGAFPRAWSAANDTQVFAIMQSVIDAWHPDAKRIHFGGYSMGGWMTWRFICNHADMLASAAPIAAGAGPAGLSCAFSDTERPSQEIPVFYTHGTTDGLVNYTSATTQVDNVTRGWQLEKKEVLGTGPDYEWTRFESPSGNVFEFLHHDWKCGTPSLAGHCFPGSAAALGCGADNAVNWPEEVLKFYKAHPKP